MFSSLFYFLSFPINILKCQIFFAFRIFMLIFSNKNILGLKITMSLSVPICSVLSPPSLRWEDSHCNVHDTMTALFYLICFALHSITLLRFAWLNIASHCIALFPLWSVLFMLSSLVHSCLIISSVTLSPLIFTSLVPSSYFLFYLYIICLLLS